MVCEKKKKLIFLNLDAMLLCSQRKCDEYEENILKNLIELYRKIIKVKPEIKMASLGYDLLSWERSQLCLDRFKRIFGEETLQEFRRNFIDRFTRINKALEKEFPKNAFYVQVWGKR